MNWLELRGKWTWFLSMCSKCAGKHTPWQTWMKRYLLTLPSVLPFLGMGHGGVWAGEVEEATVTEGIWWAGGLGSETKLVINHCPTRKSCLGHDSEMEEYRRSECAPALLAERGGRLCSTSLAALNGLQLFTQTCPWCAIPYIDSSNRKVKEWERFYLHADHLSACVCSH